MKYVSKYIQMFNLTAEDLKDLFVTDNVRDRSSVGKLNEWGGIVGLQKKIQTSSTSGLKAIPQQLHARAKHFGSNEPIIKEEQTLLSMIIETFQDHMLRILCAAAVVSLVLGVASHGLASGWLQGASILVAVVIIVTVTSGNNYIKAQQFKKLNAMAGQKNVDVTRNGIIINMSIYDILVGDIQHVETGQIISVDGLLIESRGIVADESAMTGEPDGIKKAVFGIGNYDSFLISGSKVLEGTGKMLVLAVGVHSQYGILKKQLQTEQVITPLQSKLSTLAQQIGQVGMIAAALTFVCMLLHILHSVYVGEYPLLSLILLEELVQAFIIAVSIVVVAVPEGLPLAVTIALAYSVGKMKDENNLVRYLAACETMGGADNICSDKTGTLTRNLMTVTKMFAKERILDSPSFNTLDEQFVRLLTTSICQNTNANPKIYKEENGQMVINQIGNKTECALLQVSYNLGYDYVKCRDSSKILKVFPFSSEAKTMTTISREQGKVYVLAKGAPDFLFANCTTYLGAAGKPMAVTAEFKHQFEEASREFCEQSLRTLLLAYRVGDEKEANELDAVHVLQNLTILALVGLKDPLRDAVPHAVQLCKEAGVTVRMITGDFEVTAVAIAKEAGILELDWKPKDNDYTVMTGKNFREFVGGLVRITNESTFVDQVGNMQHFKLVARDLKVLARSSPTDKNIMATGLKQLGHVVAMTGDGTNDAPALKKADIGFAMGMAGTQIAKEAAGIILLDDNFNSIVTAIKWGRNIFDSIRKFLQFQLTVNVVALVMAFVGAAVMKESPLNPIQMLWVNLIMDTLASLALATEPPTEELLRRKPYARNQHLITLSMWKNILTQAFLQILILGVILFKGPALFNIQSSIGVEQWNDKTGKHYCIFFHVFVLLQVFNEINARKLKSDQINVFKSFFNNPLFIIIFIITMIIQVLCVQFGGHALNAVPLSFDQHLTCVKIGILPVLLGPVFKKFVPESLFSFLTSTKE